MVDFRVDDGLPWHPKTLGLSLEAAGLWLYGGCWCARYQTDGHIPAQALHMFAGRNSARLIAELTSRALLVAENGGYLFTDWLDYQRSASEVAAQRELNRQRAARARARKAEQTQGFRPSHGVPR